MLAPAFDQSQPTQPTPRARIGRIESASVFPPGRPPRAASPKRRKRATVARAKGEHPPMTVLDNRPGDLERENTELRRQLDEALAERDQALSRETATAEVLQVINSSPGDLTPVFNAMLKRALDL